METWKPKVATFLKEVNARGQCLPLSVHFLRMWPVWRPTFSWVHNGFLFTKFGVINWYKEVGFCSYENHETLLIVCDIKPKDPIMNEFWPGHKLFCHQLCSGIISDVFETLSENPGYSWGQVQSSWAYFRNRTLTQFLILKKWVV